MTMPERAARFDDADPVCQMVRNARPQQILRLLRDIQAIPQTWSDEMGRMQHETD